MPPEHVLTLGHAADNEVHRALTSRIAGPREVGGLGIDPAADYGPTSLEQFPAGADDVPDLRKLQE